MLVPLNNMSPDSQMKIVLWLGITVGALPHNRGKGSGSNFIQIGILLFMNIGLNSILAVWLGQNSLHWNKFAELGLAPSLIEGLCQVLSTSYQPSVNWHQGEKNWHWKMNLTKIKINYISRIKLNFANLN